MPDSYYAFFPDRYSQYRFKTEYDHSHLVSENKDFEYYSKTIASQEYVISISKEPLANIAPFLENGVIYKDIPLSPFLTRVHSEFITNIEGRNHLITYTNTYEQNGEHFLNKNSLSDENFKSLTLSLLTGLNELHAHNIAHTNINPYSILLFEENNMLAGAFSHFHFAKNLKEIPLDIRIKTNLYALTYKVESTPKALKHSDRFALCLTLMMFLSESKKTPLLNRLKIRMREMLPTLYSLTQFSKEKNFQNLYNSRNRRINLALEEIKKTYPEIGKLLEQIQNPEIDLSKIIQSDLFKEVRPEIDKIKQEESSPSNQLYDNSILEKLPDQIRFETSLYPKDIQKKLLKLFGLATGDLEQIEKDELDEIYETLFESVLLPENIQTSFDQYCLNLLINIDEQIEAVETKTVTAQA